MITLFDQETILKNYVAAEKRKSRDEGQAEGENKLGRLINVLISNNRSADVIKASIDVDARQKLYSEFEIV